MCIVIAPLEGGAAAKEWESNYKLGDFFICNGAFHVKFYALVFYLSAQYQKVNGSLQHCHSLV